MSSNLQGSGPVPIPIQHPNPNPNPNPQQKSLSFDQVSKCFNLPLSDAAESLGVCGSVLKKICYENGLVRWPHREVLSGKSIEDIKKDASKEKQEQRVKFPIASGEKHDSLAGSSTSSPLNISSTMEMPRTGALPQQQGTKNTQSGTSPHIRNFYLTKGSSLTSDEFKYGFPSEGLATVTYRWWGNKSPDDGTKDSQKNDENTENSKEEAENLAGNSTGTSLLTDVRKRAAREGKETLKLGVYKGHNASMLNSTKRKILDQVFKSYFHVDGDMTNVES